MKNKREKISFWVHPEVVGGFIILKFITLVATVLFLLFYLFGNQTLTTLTTFLAAAFCFIFLLLLSFFRSYVWVAIYFDKIIVRGVFGILTTSEIDKIKRVYIQDSWIVLEDDRVLKSPHYKLKNYYVRFAHSLDREKVVRSFWAGEIERLPPRN